MKIAYSINGEGFGHASRMVSIAPKLAVWHSLELFMPNTVATWVQKRLPGFSGSTIPAFTFKKRKDRILYCATLWENFKQLFSLPSIIFSIARKLKREKFDAVLSDFEPCLAWAGRLAGLRVVQFNHPGIVRRFTSCNPDSLAASFVAILMEGPYTKRLHCSFFHGDCGPMIRPELLSARATPEDFILVNLKTGYREAVCAALETLARTNPQLRWKLFPSATEDFTQSLANCRAVITAAGHQMLSEALVLGKPVLAIPQAGQYEQKLNAIMVAKSGRGMWTTLDKLSALLPSFLSALPALSLQIRKKSRSAFVFEDCSDNILSTLSLHLSGLQWPAQRTLVDARQHEATVHLRA